MRSCNYEPDSNLLLNKKYYVSSTTPDGTYKQWGWAAEYLNDGIAQNGNGWDVECRRQPRRGDRA